ncbi:HS12A-like protein, partial [Mya arenaria]
AEIDPVRLKLALESECASIWCETLSVDVKGAVAIAGSQYMVVDLGAERISALGIQENSITPKGRDKLKIVGTIIQSWFKGPINLLIQHIKSLLAEAKMERVQTIILVGGFGESPYVQKRMRNEIAGVRLIVPPDAGLAVLKGAVRFGHNPSIVASRIMKYTYGTSRFKSFNKKKHPADKKVWKNGEWLVPNCFKVYVRVNEEVGVDHQVTIWGTPFSKISRTSVYRTTQVNPDFTTDPGCELLGTIELENSSEVPFKDQDKEDTFLFGDTELLVKTKNTFTGKEAFMTFECFK